MSPAESLVSIILPTHNRGTSIHQSIESVVEQSFSKFGLIVVDSSTDRDAKVIIEKIGDDRIRYCQQEKQGQSSANIPGIKISRYVGTVWINQMLGDPRPPLGVESRPSRIVTR